MKKVYLLIGLIVVFSIFTLGTTVFANDFGLKETASAAKLDTYGDSVPTIAGNIIGTLLSMISVLFFVLVLYGGILWMTARGNSETTEKALNTIIAATIGIIIIIGAYALTNFVFKLGAGTGNGPGDTLQPESGGTCVVDQAWCTSMQGQGGVVCNAANDQNDREGYCQVGGTDGASCVVVTSGHKCAQWNGDETNCRATSPKCTWIPS